MSHSTANDLTGQRYGRLVAQERAGRIGAHAAWTCACDCGVSKIVSARHLRFGSTRSCGCQRREGGPPRHGMCGSATYRTWQTMKQRCSYRGSINYHLYGGRGIRICSRWGSFENFLADMGERPHGMSLDRIDNNGNYEPANCRWSDRRTQAQNRRNNVLVTHNGETLTVAELARRAGLPRGVVGKRLSRGWSIDEAIRP